MPISLRALVLLCAAATACGSAGLAASEASTIIKAQPGFPFDNAELAVNGISTFGKEAIVKFVIASSPLTVKFRHYDDGNWIAEEVERAPGEWETVSAAFGRIRNERAGAVRGEWLQANAAGYAKTFDVFKGWALLIRGASSWGGVGRDWRPASSDEVLLLFPKAKASMLASSLPATEDEMLLDAWGGDLAFAFAKDIPEIRSAGPDKRVNSGDDFVVRIDRNGFPGEHYSGPSIITDELFGLSSRLPASLQRWQAVAGAGIEGSPFQVPTPVRAR